MVRAIKNTGQQRPIFKVSGCLVNTPPTRVLSCITGLWHLRVVLHPLHYLLKGAQVTEGWAEVTVLPGVWQLPGSGALARAWGLWVQASTQLGTAGRGGRGESWQDTVAAWCHRCSPTLNAEALFLPSAPHKPGSPKFGHMALGHDRVSRC